MQSGNGCPTPTPPDPLRGFTLIEQVMVIAIIAVLATVAIRPMRDTLTRHALQTRQLDYIEALQQARISAITLGVPTVFCPSQDGATCADSSMWDKGWLLGRDRDGDRQPDGSPLYLGMSDDAEVRVRSGSGRHSVRFRPDGSAVGSNLTLLLCIAGQPARAVTVVVSNAGRIRGAPASTDQAASCSNGA